MAVESAPGDFPRGGGVSKITRMVWYQWVLLVLLIALIAFWVIMKKRAR